MTATRWTDKRSIYFLTSGCVPEASNPLTIRRQKKNGEAIEVPAPPSVIMYNQKMGGVDLNDKMAKLDKSRKSYKWYSRVDRKLITWSLYNAYVLYKAANANVEYREFVLSILHDWVGPPSRITRPPAPSAPQRITPDGHYPCFDNNSTTDKRCVVCEKKYTRGRGSSTQKGSIRK